MPSDCLQRALSLLAMREHSARELENKLLAKGYQQQEIQLALSECQQQGYQSDERYVQTYIHSRSQRGYGPIKVRLELKAKGIADEMINHSIDQSVDWFEIASKALQKKFKQASSCIKEHAKRQRYLLNRGFSHEMIKHSIAEFNSEL
jgi:regulatory protein